MADNLCRELSEKVPIRVFCSSKAYNNKLEKYFDAELVYVPLKANGIQSVLYDLYSMLLAKKNTDCIILLGVSGAIFLPIVRLLYRGRIIVNVDGMEWKREKWGLIARSFLKKSEEYAVKYADTVVADNEGIAEYLKKQYNVECACIAYGGDQASRKELTDEVAEKYNIVSNKYAFMVCRIEPENNVEVILNAFAMSTKKIVIVGNWNNSSFGKEMKSRFSGFKNISVIDPIYDLGVLDQIRSNAWVYIHGHSAGGTNPSLVEAMSLNLPIVAFDINFNRITTENKALYFNESADLLEIIENVCDKQLLAIRSEMLKVAEKKYTWKKIAQQYLELVGGERV